MVWSATIEMSGIFLQNGPGFERLPDKESGHISACP